eukprot:COSAG01_NODE_31495_length_596_cov_1.390342_1_plen_48_part_10
MSRVFARPSTLHTLWFCHVQCVYVLYIKLDIVRSSRTMIILVYYYTGT